MQASVKLDAGDIRAAIAEYVMRRGWRVVDEVILSHPGLDESSGRCVEATVILDTLGLEPEPPATPEFAGKGTPPSLKRAIELGYEAMRRHGEID